MAYIHLPHTNKGLKHIIVPSFLPASREDMMAILKHKRNQKNNDLRKVLYEYSKTPKKASLIFK